MTEFQAGFGRVDITPAVGCRLIGYGNRAGGSVGIHDSLLARAMVIESAGQRWALVSCELCSLSAATVQKSRTAVERRTGIAPEHLFLAATHTHSGPHDRDTGSWERPLDELIADAVQEAVGYLRPAHIASGYGMLYGYSINRRWIDRPVDPGLAVIRIDDSTGKPLGLLANFACHAVVMGSDNLHISADWPGYACARLEAELGSDTTCLFFQGGAGNINPLVAGVRQHLRGVQPVTSIGNISTYYGSNDHGHIYNIGDRRGGTFDEVAELGNAFVVEAMHVYRGLQPTPPGRAPWSKQIVVQAVRGPEEPPPGPSSRSPTVTDYEELLAAGIPAEIMLFGLGDVLLVGQPGEVFAETALKLRIWLRTLGYATPILVSYANGWLSYLPEPADFPEGGYEVSRAYGMGTSRYFQKRVREALERVIGPM